MWEKLHEMSCSPVVQSTNLMYSQSCTFGPSLGYQNSMITMLIIMKTFISLVLVTNNKYREYQEKSRENVSLKGAQKPKNVTF